ncbi:ammonium transporter [Nitzschia inconspicua]|uniref:Ammonium transporter n=1 Tax=Nitzschia inconspicua TaxID=303405 RepID=A0A9K3L0I9_9STRA|nr:ammonium transporter [Nitzschia inconspicua]
MERCQLIANALDGESEVLQCVVTTTSAKAEALDARIDNLAASLDIVFLLFASIVMFTMQAGFAMFCAGSVRRKNVHNTLLKNFLDACGCAVAFFVCGYAFAYGGTNGVIFPEDMNVPHPTTFIGTENFLLIDFDNYALWMYQFAFAATCTTIVAGTLAERSQMVAYFLYSTLLSGFVFPVNAHAVWSVGGFLNANKSNRLFGSGMIDFAGSGVVHFTGGLTALIASKILGPRKDRFNEDLGNPLHVPNPIQGCSVSLQVLGTLLLWFGWYGFNAGGLHFVFTEEYANVAALAMVTTTLSAACGTISSLALSAYYSYRQSGEIKFEVSYALNGCLSGLVAITGSCAFIEPWVSLIIGMVAGVIYNLASRFMVHCRIDDAVDAIPVHLFNGIWGVIAVGLFASPNRMETAFGRMDHVGWFYSWGRGSSDATLLAANTVGLLLIFCFVVVVMYPFFSILMYLGWLRSDPLEEILGLDCRYHRGKTHREIDHEDADESLVESSDNLQEVNLIGKTNGRFLLGKSNAPFKRNRHERWDISSNAADEIDAHSHVASNISLLDLELSTTDCNRTSFR